MGDEKACFAGFVTAEGAISSCAVKGVTYTDEMVQDSPWHAVWSGEQEREITDGNGEPKKVWVKEEDVIWYICEAFQNGVSVRETCADEGKLPGGVWIGGAKFTVTREDITESEPFVKFVNMAWNGDYVVCGLFKKPEQDSGNCDKAVLNFASE